MKLNPKFKFSDNSFLITENSDATIPVGTRFQLEYKGTVCDFGLEGGFSSEMHDPWPCNVFTFAQTRV
jgi:hypothetical protein